MAAQKEYQLGNKAKELLIYTTKATMNTNFFPKSVRFTYAHELQNTAKAILKNIHAANECLFQTEHKKRLDLIKQVLDDCNFMLQLLEVCLELGFIDAKKCGHWSNLILNIKYMSAAWKKKDGERAKKIMDDEAKKRMESQRALIIEVVRQMRQPQTPPTQTGEQMQ